MTDECRAQVAGTPSSLDGQSTEAKKIISDQALFYFKTYLTIALTWAISCLGVVANILNLIVFKKQGVRDNVNITFMALSLWDLGVCFLSVLASICFVLDIYFPTSDVDFMTILYVYIAYARGFMYVLSTLVTVYLSLERCVCIVFPLKVQEIFTQVRVVVSNIALALFGVCCIGPAWATQGVQWEANLTTNRSRLVLWVSFNRRHIDLFVDTFSGMVLPVLAQLLITASAGFMIHGIRKSARFRQQSADTPRQSASNEESSAKRTSHSLNKTMTSKDLKLTKVVVLLAIIFFSCNLPVFTVAFVRALIPELDIGKVQYNLYIVVYAAVYQFVLLNSSVSIFVYYHVSTRYKHEFLALFGVITS